MKGCLGFLVFAWFALVAPLNGDPETKLCDKFYTPFQEEERTSYQTIHDRTISTYGAHRNSYLRGHKHSGIDLRGTLSEKVYAVGIGQVVDVHLSFPHLMLVVKHLLSEEQVVYSSYKHIEDIQVEIDQWVDENIHLARLFNAEEKAKAGFGVNHLHFEIRKSIGDGGEASWTSMSLEELDEYCIDPLVFFGEQLER